MKSIRVWLQLALLGGLPVLHAQTMIDLRTQTKSVDFSSAVSTKPSKTVRAAHDMFSGRDVFQYRRPAGQNLYGCTAANTWSLLGSNLWFGAATSIPATVPRSIAAGTLCRQAGLASRRQPLQWRVLLLPRAPHGFRRSGPAGGSQFVQRQRRDVDLSRRILGACYVAGGVGCK